LIHYHAAWVLPISSPPLRDAWVTVDRGRIVAAATRYPGAGGREVDLGDVAVMPGLVNAHTHLELSYLRDAVPPASQFVTWIRHVIAARRTRPDPASSEILAAVDRAIDEAVGAGTAVVGDISNTLATFAPLAHSALAAVVFYELIQFAAPDPRAFVEARCRQLEALAPTERVRCSLAAHAPYSVGPLVFRAIREAADRVPFAPCSVHLSESEEEMAFIRTGRGPWRELLEELGVWDPAWVPPGGTPVQFLHDNGFLDGRVLAVHAVHATQEDLQQLAARGATVVTCPRSNGHTGAGAPPIDDFYRSGVRVAVGTDSLASTPDLNVFAELATMRALAPHVPASRLLGSATQEGARALGFDADYGTIEPGKRARLLAINVPPSIEDVEEYLVTETKPSQIAWTGTDD
jgi:cytosine/adenosine deaminase-related metal-dependent hydrolase